MTDEIPKVKIEDPPEGEPFTLHEAWLDLLHAATDDGLIPIHPFTERWSWERDRVQQFFRKLEAKDHIRAYDASRWCLISQVQEESLALEYEHIWSIYPKRVAKRKGYHAYAATRKGRPKDEEPIVSARILYMATKAYAKSREGEDQEFTMHPATFFGTDYRWRDKPKTNSKPKGKNQWSRPTNRDLTKAPQAGTAKSRGPKTRTPATPPPKKKSPRKKSPKKNDPLADL